VNDSINQAPHPTVQDALAELPIFAAMLAAANVAAAVVLFPRPTLRPPWCCSSASASAWEGVSA
jgi:hypothetical protein